MAWLDTMEDWKWMLGNWDRVLEAAGVHPGARCFFAFPSVRFLAFGRHTNLLPKGVVYAYLQVGRARSSGFMVS